VGRVVLVLYGLPSGWLELLSQVPLPLPEHQRVGDLLDDR
jgi:hypothetical protein